MINREEAFILLNKYLKDADNIRYSLAVEAILRELARRLERDEELWGLTGLLHNLDYEYTRNELDKRGSISAQLLENLLPDRAINAIKANNYMHTGYIPTTSLDKSLIAADASVGFIITTSHLMPSKKLSELDMELLMSKFYDTSFAIRYNRSKIQLCADVGMDLASFLGLCLEVLGEMSDELNI